ncbi:DUF2062 domain-containing protein [Sphingorhabdus contaminans]|jgi:uncharacterized protein|uniref:DUF2062 domain-containing protein n=1 Tax=Sphingorhabdus contaminans TaxID=1343899 RepID=A0A553WI17_9SPHN|nr:DUF2062 domain-containing protein [Sphingorhabdus contaminans]TSB04347.1 DUF2062 domain-containing protein [Sphingorhabdus contaminans]
MSKFGAWIQRQAPTRDSFERSRFLRPFAQRVFHPALWRFTRRSVPRGVALGLLVGIFLLIPGVQIAGVALLALPVRANIPIGAAMTFLSMPATTPFILFASVYVGESVLRLSGGSGRFYQLIESSAPLSAWLDFVWTEAPMAFVQGVAGLAIISVVAAALGYVLAAWFWRWWISAKWRRRSKSLAAGG